jgi:hypothetical protein
MHSGLLVCDVQPVSERNGMVFTMLLLDLRSMISTFPRHHPLLVSRTCHTQNNTTQKLLQLLRMQSSRDAL